MPLKPDKGSADPGLTRPRSLKRRLRSFLEHHSLRCLREYYSGLGTCLLYHRVGSRKFYSEEASPYSGLTVAKESFEEQLYFFKKNFNCISLPKAVELLSEGALPHDSLIITFDDGYKDNLVTALPLLEKYEIPATVYVATGLLHGTAELWWFEQEFIIKNCSRIDFKWEGDLHCWPLHSPEEKYAAILTLNELFKRLTLFQQKILMRTLRSQCPVAYSYENEILTLEELKKLDSHPLITIGAHSKNHPMLNRLDKANLSIELHESKEDLETILGHAVSHLAYPFGGRHEVSRREFEAARDCGFVSAVTTRHGHLYEEHRHYLHTLPRISVNYEDSLESLKWKLSGIFSMLHQRGKRLAVN